MEYLFGLTLFGSGVYFGLLMALLFIILVICEYNDSGAGATLVLVLSMMLLVFGSNIDFKKLLDWRIVIGYMSIGFIFSLIRTYFKGRELDSESRRMYDLKSAVFRWWFYWPISMINWFFGTILSDFFELVYEKIERVYHKLFGI